MKTITRSVTSVLIYLIRRPYVGVRAFALFRTPTLKISGTLLQTNEHDGKNRFGNISPRNNIIPIAKKRIFQNTLAQRSTNDDQSEKYVRESENDSLSLEFQTVSLNKLEIPHSNFNRDSSLEFISPEALPSHIIRFSNKSTLKKYLFDANKSLANHLNVPHPLGRISKRRTPLICGHRGSLYQEPENTIAGFLNAYENGADAVEFDVFLLKCGNLVVFHGAGDDENPGLLHDNIGIEGSILDYTAEEARMLLFNSFGSEFGCPWERLVAPTAFIPTLKEVLEVLKDTGVVVKIELKGQGTAEPVLELVESMDMVDQCHYASFDHSRIARIRELRPEHGLDGSHIYKTGALFVDPPDNFIDMSMAVGASEVHLKYDTCTKERVASIHANGMGSMAWWRGPPGMLEDTTEKYLDVGNEDEMMYLTVMNSGVGTMCVNKPDILISMLSCVLENNEYCTA